MADRIDIGWLDVDRFIKTVYGQINKGKQTYLTAITVNDGLVLVNTEYAWELIRRQVIFSPALSSLPTADAEKVRKDILLSVVELFRSMGFINGAWINHGCFHSKFNLTDKDGDKIWWGWFIPFNFKAFEKLGTYEKCEKRKRNELRRLTRAEIAERGNWQERLFPSDRQEEHNDKIPEPIDIQWFNADEFILEIHKRINRGICGRFSAITVNEGLVLVLTSSAWWIAKKQAKRAGVELDEKESDIKKRVIMAIVKLFGERGFIDNSWLNKGHSDNWFELFDKNNNWIQSCWAIPFRFEAFEKFNTLKEYEQRKKGNLKQITKAILSQNS